MKNEDTTGAQVAVAGITCLGAIAFVIAATFLSAFVLRDLWFWFIVPFGLPALGLAHAMGINMTIAFLTKNPFAATKSDVKQDGKPYTDIITAVCYVLITWGLGYVVQSFM